MSADQKLTATRLIPFREIERVPGPPSNFLRELEAGLIGELARTAALDGRRFVDWPKLTLVTEYERDYLRDVWRLHAEVVVK